MSGKNQTLNPLERVHRWICVHPVGKAVMVLLVVLAFFLLKNKAGDFSDFAVYYEAGLKSLKGHTVYDVIGHYQFKYAPSVALYFGILFGWLPFSQASWVFYFLSLILWSGTLIFFSHWLSNQSRSQKSPTFQRICFHVFLFLLFFMIPLRDELALGQVNGIPFLLVLLSFWLQEKGSKSVFVGTLLAAAIQFKLFILIFLPFFLFRKNWRVLFWTVTSFLMLSFLPLLFTGGLSFSWSENLAWVTSLSASSADLLISEHNVSLVGMLGRGFGMHLWIWAIWGGFVFQFLVFQWHFRKASLMFNFAFPWPWILILNPLGWKYWMLFSFPVLLLVVERYRREWRGFAWVFLPMGVIFSLQNQPWTYQSGLVTGMVLILIGLSTGISVIQLESKTIET